MGNNRDRMGFNGDRKGEFGISPTKTRILPTKPEDLPEKNADIQLDQRNQNPNCKARAKKLCSIARLQFLFMKNEVLTVVNI